MKKKLITLLILVLTIFLIGCVSQSAKFLGQKEVRDYNGEKLSSVNDFVENSIKGPQYINISGYKLKITGLVSNPIELSYNQVLDLPNYQKVVTLDCVEGWSVKILWEGVLVKDIIQQAKPTKFANTIIFHAYDGYTTSFPLDYVINNKILIAYKMNNLTLPPARGFPFELVAESKWGYKWIKWITEIELSNDTNYKGYWEMQGYSNSGDLNQSFTE